MKLDSNATKRAAEIYKNLEDVYNKIHNNKYDYSKAVYLNSKTKMCIICPEHGEFWQCHNKHGSNKQGCPKCSGKEKGNLEEFVMKANQIHGSKYDYSKVVYEKRHSKVTIICPVHGEFEQIPTNHLSGKGCDKCAHDSLGLVKRITKKEFLKRANDIHNCKYTYSNYTKASDKVKIMCPQHGEFTQYGTSHLSGCGCPSCAISGFDFSKPAILYYLEINNGIAYKIGITNRTVELRFSPKELENVKVLKVWEYIIGKDAYEEEQRILKEFKANKYTGTPLLSSGNSELFNTDVLLLAS